MYKEEKSHLILGLSTLDFSKKKKIYYDATQLADSHVARKARADQQYVAYLSVA